jgi:Carboxypeptidase regulatory-like domain/TonB dependent receptor
MSELPSAHFDQSARLVSAQLRLVIRSNLLFGVLLLILVPFTTKAQGVIGSIKGTVSATTNDPAARPAALAGARVLLVNTDLKAAPVKSQTDETGAFAFLDLPGGNYTLTAEADGLPTVTRELHLGVGAGLVVDVVLTASVSESVVVHDEEGLLSTSESTTSNTVRAQRLGELPLRSENYQSALPLTPGVLRGLDGLNHIKGTRGGQNAYTVNGVDVTDPVNGNLAFDIPIEAAASVHIEENPYSAEFGRFTGGATNLETKSGGDKFKIGASRFIPTFRNIIGGKIDSFRPRLTFSGPLVRKRLYFLQSFEYRFSRVRVPSLKAPVDDSTAEAFSSFTQLDLIVNDANRLKFVAALFPEKQRFVGLNTFNPRETTPNTKQRGELISLSEQAVFQDQSFLSSLVSYKTFEFSVFAQGLKPLTVSPDGNTGNYFADSRRLARRTQWQEGYFARPHTFHGQHSLKVGSDFEYTRMSGDFSFRPIVIRRRDQTISERIDFTGPTTINRVLAEFGGFVQDRWVINKRLTVDAGLRLDRDSISTDTSVAPRFSFLLLPFKSDRTIIRGGVGLFYDRSTLSSKYFEQQNLNDRDELINSSLGVVSPARFPARIVTTFAPDGVTVVDGPRAFVNAVKGPLHSPRSMRWSLQLDRQLTKGLTARIGYLQRSTLNEPIIYPRLTGTASGMLILKNRGRSAYDELQMIAIYNGGRLRNFNLSYVLSRARGHLNTADNFLGDFPALVVQPNEYGPLPFDAPHRFLAYGEVKAPLDLTISPSFEIRSGFPFSFVNERLEFVGARNRAGRFPTFVSLDASILKGFKVPFLDKRARAGVVVFNITNHFNPRDVQNNIGSLHLGEFYNSLGTSVRGKFELDF